MRRSERRILFIALFTAISLSISAQEKHPIDYVNPFIGTSNYGATNPGAVTPHGMMSITPFNSTGSLENKFDKDRGWWSMPYEPNNKVIAGFSHVNLSGVGCPELASLLLMPTTGPLDVDINNYGSHFTQEKASPGYYSTLLTKYGINCEMTVTPRTSAVRFIFPAGRANILMNLGEGLTNETGAFVSKVNEREIEGYKLQGTFCFTEQQAVFPLYFVMRVSKTPLESGYWKKQRFRKGYKEEWDPSNGKYKIYTDYDRVIAGDDIGAWFSYDLKEGEIIEVRVGVSFVSIENARLNLDREQYLVGAEQLRNESSTKTHTETPTPLPFETIHQSARSLWSESLNKINVEGGNEDDKTIFYTALYHSLIHPNIIQDANGEYPAMGSGRVMKTERNRYTVFSLWDTYRTLHQLITLLYPDRQSNMVNSMVEMYNESGWLPKWELYSRETLTMEGDPAIPVIVDSWMKGIRGFDIETAYEAMTKSTLSPSSANPLRPDNDDYLRLGYVPLREPFDNSVSHALEYYIADWCLGELAKVLGKEKDAKIFHEKSLGYKHYYSPEFGTLRPKLPDGTFYSPFDPLQGANFEPCPGFHEGNAWNYTFAVPHNVIELAELMGGKKHFVNKLQMVFDKGYFDPTNEPDIVYPYLFSYFKGEEWRTQKIVKDIIDRHYKTTPDGLPGNDDTGTLSSWVLFSMIGVYPNCPGKPEYIITTPRFDKVTLLLNGNALNIQKRGTGNIIKSIYIDGVKQRGYLISHEKLVSAKNIIINTGQ